jgi:restriction system protein
VSDRQSCPTTVGCPTCCANSEEGILARCALRVIFEILRAEPFGHLRSISFNGMVAGLDPSTGHPDLRCLASCTAERSDFVVINLGAVDPVRCFEALPGRLSSKPDEFQAVRPGRLPESLGSPVSDQADDDLDLSVIDPTEFEQLVASLFNAMGFEVM